MPDNNTSNNNNPNITAKPLEVNKVNPTTGNTDVGTSNNINNVQGGTPNPFDMLGSNNSSRRSPTINNINRLNNSARQEAKKNLATDNNSQEASNQQDSTDPQPLPTNSATKPQDKQKFQAPSIPAPLPPKSSFLQQLDSRRKQLTDSLTPNIPKPSQYQQGTPRPTGPVSISQILQEKSKEKMMLMSARVLAWFSSILISFIIWAIIMAFILAIFGALTMFILDTACAAGQSISFAGLPNEVKSVCEYYAKLKGGCFGGSVEKKDELPLTLKCIGENWDSSEDSVELYNAKSKTNVKKQIIKEIIKAGKEAKVKDDTIYYTIAIHPLVSGDNNWKETTSNTCFGIAQFCKNSENSNYNQATSGLNVSTPEDYIKSPVLQMKSIEQYLNLKNKEIVKVPECIKKKFVDNNALEFKISYIWFDQDCNEKNKSDGSEKTIFAKSVQNNFNIINCLEFKSKLTATIDKTQYEDFSFVQNEKVYNINNENSNNQFMINSFANHTRTKSGEIYPTEPFAISAIGCQLFKTYAPMIEASLKKYKPTKQFPVLSLAIIGGLLWEESNMGTDNVPKGCAGYGDGGAGHGLGQADPTSNDFPTKQERQPVGTKVKIRYPGLPITEVAWSDCQGGIDYAVTHKLEVAALSEPYAIKKLQSAGMNMARKTDGVFEDIKTQKAYISLLIDSNNAGACGMAGGVLCPELQRPNAPGCTIEKGGEIVDNCTTNGHYSHRVLVSAVNAMKCLGKNITEEQILTDTSGTGLGGSSGVSCDTNGTNLNAQGSEFPLVTKKGSNIKIFYSQPFPEYIGGGAHRGIDVSPGTNKAVDTAVVSTFNGTVTAIGNVVSTSCNVTCDTKTQRYVILQEDGTGLSTTAIHLNPKQEAPKKVGEKVAKGDTIGQIDEFMFVHLHYETRLNGTLQNPITQIKGFNQALKASDVRAESSIIDPALYEKL